ncbi:hypothetical protein EJ07DRAFT_184095 [Lizonia empirigonia]|nr:hypothetical protein EJ07DRAFT_184095 [Lizonia empirigonia]
MANQRVTATAGRSAIARHGARGTGCGSQLANPPNLVPVFSSISAEFLTPSSIYLKISAKSKSNLSFLFESAATTETIGRYSFVGADPRKVIKTGPGHGEEADPLPSLEKELAKSTVATVPSIQLPPMTGGAVGYVGYDCVKYFEPKTRRDDVKDILGVPESLFMLFDTVVALDHFAQVVKVITYVKVPDSLDNLEQAYDEAKATLKRYVTILKDKEVPMPEQGPIKIGNEYTSNIGQNGYESHVKELKKHISVGDIIQAVPSQRFARPTSLHPFNIYRNLRNVNPSPYLFFVDCEDFQIVGASPELLVKEEQGRIITHPIAGTVKRGKTLQEDAALAEELSNSLKDRAEHFSHVQHLVSEVSGVLRPGKTRFDAFRSIFPAGTVSGAPKVRAMELIAELEKEKRGVYAGAVGYFGYGSVDGDKQIEGAMDTCIALRSMLVKDGIAYLQAGGGIVFDSDPTMTEEKHLAEQTEGEVDTEKSQSLEGDEKPRISVAALAPLRSHNTTIKMKQSMILLAAVAGAASAQSLGSCAQMCVNNMNIIANTEFSCAAGDTACFCTKSNWAYGVRDCSRQACSGEESAQAVSYAASLCQGVASSASGSTTALAALPILTSALASASGASGTASGEATATGSSQSAITTVPLLATVTNSDGSVQTTTSGFSTVYSSGALTESAASAASSAASSVASEVSSGLSSIAESASSALASASGALSSAASAASSAASSIASAAGSAASSAASSVPSQGAAPQMTGVPVVAGLAAAAWFFI